MRLGCPHCAHAQWLRRAPRQSCGASERVSGCGVQLSVFCGSLREAAPELGISRKGKGREEVGEGERGGRTAGRGGAGLGPAPGWELSRARCGGQCQATGGEAALQSPTRRSSRELARQPELGGKLAPECWGLKGGSERWLWGEPFGDYDVWLRGGHLVAPLPEADLLLHRGEAARATELTPRRFLSAKHGQGSGHAVTMPASPRVRGAQGQMNGDSCWQVPGSGLRRSGT